MLEDFGKANAEGKQDMFEEAAERMITAEKALRAKDETIADLKDKLSIKTLENIKGASVLDDKNETIAALRVRLAEAEKLITALCYDTVRQYGENGLTEKAAAFLAKRD